MRLDLEDQLITIEKATDKRRLEDMYNIVCRRLTPMVVRMMLVELNTSSITQGGKKYPSDKTQRIQEMVSRVQCVWSRRKSSVLIKFPGGYSKQDYAKLNSLNYGSLKMDKREYFKLRQSNLALIQMKFNEYLNEEFAKAQARNK